MLGHAKKNGVEHFYVEQDLAADPTAQLGASIRLARLVWSRRQPLRVAT